MSPTTLPIAGSYVAALVTAVLVGLCLAAREGTHRGFDRRRWLLLLVTVFLGSYLGSKWFFFDLSAPAAGRMSNLGGIVGGLLTTAVMVRLLGLSWRTSLDAMTVPALVGMAIGRVGCFLDGCCRGIATSLPWAVHYHDHADADPGVRVVDLGVHPVQLYEAAGDLVLAGLLARTMHGAPPGRRIQAGMIGYALLRMATETLRAGREVTLGLNPVQWALLLAILLIGVWVWWDGQHRTFSWPGRLALPSMGALLLFQVADTTTTRPPDEVLVGGSAWHLPYTIALGEALVTSEFTNCEGVRETRTETRRIDAKRASAAAGGSLGWRHWFDRERRLTVTGTALAGTNRTTQVALQPMSPTLQPHPLMTTVEERVGLTAFGAGFTLESASGAAGASYLVGRFVRDGRQETRSLMGAKGRVGSRGLYLEGQIVSSGSFENIGELSYGGLGYGFGRLPVRFMLGFGEGFATNLEIPAERVELTASYRVSGRAMGKVESGRAVTVGARVRLRR
jgi:phosphatidylglycerol---prolipoprotein diacylglyceryl transferase